MPVVGRRNERVWLPESPRDGVAPPPPERTRPGSIVRAADAKARLTQRIQAKLGKPARLGDTDARLTRRLHVRAPDNLPRRVQRWPVVLPAPRRLGDTDARLTRRLHIRAADNLARRAQRIQPWIEPGTQNAVGVADERTRPATVLRAADAKARLTQRIAPSLPENPKEPAEATVTIRRTILRATGPRRRAPGSIWLPRHAKDLPAAPVDRTAPATILVDPLVGRQRARVQQPKIGKPARLGETDARRPAGALLVTPPSRRPSSGTVWRAAPVREQPVAPSGKTKPLTVLGPRADRQRVPRLQPQFGTPARRGDTDARLTAPLRVRAADHAARWGQRIAPRLPRGGWSITPDVFAMTVAVSETSMALARSEAALTLAATNAAATLTASAATMDMTTGAAGMTLAVRSGA